ncbi:TraT complement resistance protein [Tibeticola sediminis]|uniref:TraT complement resistance protein n=1 Tax=Tibeticola sediminis TaxID=1917811 RepID=A0A3N4U7X0_9BURK|nr:complement resistance protein TraT [Tibeticola sediminis]RPE63059.1 TraT complement resistance protein [Tibeticola sediminis]
MKHSFFTVRSLRTLIAAAMVGAAVTASLTLSGCAATQVALANKDLQVQSAVSQTIFLPMTSDKTYALAVRSTTAEDVGAPLVEAEIHKALAAKGYVQAPPEKAHFLIQLNIVRAVGNDTAAGSNGGGMLAGAALAGANGSTGRGVLAGALVGGVVDAIAGATTKKVIVSLSSELQIGVRGERQSTGAAAQAKEKAEAEALARRVQDGSDADVTYHQTSIDSWMKQVNLDFQEAIPQLRTALVRNVVGFF